MPQLTFIQMSGAPGSGKTTVARALAPKIDAIVIDHDITKTALLDADISTDQAGRASYGVLHVLARDLLSQGRSVIFDSPCFYDDLLKRGRSLAREFSAHYRYVECVVKDIDELDRRFHDRKPMRSQRRGIAIPPIDVGEPETGSPEKIHADLLENAKRPESYLVVDTMAPLATQMGKILAYIQSGDSPPSL